MTRPWWLPPVLGRIPDVEPRLIRLLGLVSLALLFESYDVSMLTSALKHIAEDLQMPEHDLGRYLGTIRLGALPAIVFVPLADRFGRRRLFLGTLAGMSAATVATAFVPDPVTFVACQMTARVFLVISTAVAIVIVTEEFPAAHRGWAIGVMGALSATGFGLGALLFSQIERLPYGWRALYLVGAVPLLMLPLFRRGVPETRRFAAMAAERARGTGAVDAWLGPLRELVQTYPGRAGVLTAAIFLVALGDVAVFQFTAYYAQTVHGWTPEQYAVMFILSGAVGVVGNIVAGRLGDAVGRRAVGVTALAVFPLTAWLFYFGPAWVMPIAFAAFVFCQTAGVTMLRALSSELFPTSYRGTATAWAMLAQTVGWASGLWLVSVGTRGGTDIATATATLASVVLVGGLLLLALPETGRRELEAISDDAGRVH
ncbi:MAG TPA: MFS transporter [Candidatus Limnocylindria bacterium]|nr:MFS transporter [Candidatus Limnocylindria bacterium]